MMRPFLVWACLGLSLTRGDEVPPLVQAALEAEARLDPAAALGYFRQADLLQPDDPFILQKISRQLSDQTPAAASLEEKRALATEALRYARRAVELDPRNAVNVLSLAICYGKLGLYGDTRTKVEYSRLIRRYAEEALALAPDYDWAHHVLGRWHYEVAELGATKRFFVRLVYGGLAPAALPQAVAHLERAVELAPETLSHHVELGLAYVASGRPAEAQAALRQALALPPREIHDREALTRATQVLLQLDAGNRRPGVGAEAP